MRKKKFKVSGPYSKVRPAKLTNHSARTKRYNNRQERLANQHQYQNEKNAYSSTITDEIRNLHATVQSTFAFY